MVLKELSSVKLRFIEPMNARLVQHLPEGSEWQYEIKLDGYRCEQKPADDGQQIKEQIEGFFRYCPCLSVKEIEQCLGRYEREGKLRGLRTGFLKNPSMATARMPQFSR